MATVRARYENGVLTPLEPLDLEEGKEVEVSVRETLKAKGDAPPKNPGPGAESIHDMFDRLRASIPEGAFDGMPTDGAKNYKHYLYGHPKVED